MRIDKFLWCVRIFKTRAQAKEACVAGKVWVNGDLAKPSRLVGEEDVIQVRKQAIDYEYEVLDIPKSRVGPALVEGLIDNITSADELHKLELMKLQYKDVMWNRTPGRPTKKQRRDLDKFRK